MMRVFSFCCLALGMPLCLVSCTDSSPNGNGPNPGVATPTTSTSTLPESTQTAAQSTTAAQNAEPATQPGADQHEPQLLLSPDEFRAGWISLFDGHSLFGWKANSDANWSVEDGAIRADSGSPGLLLTTFRLADFELRVDYRLESGGNSGLFLRTPREPEDPSKDCYELNMCDSHPAFPTGSLVGRKKSAANLKGEGAWKTFNVRLEGPRITAILDGVPTIDLTDTSESAQRSGYIGLQMNGGAIEFRNVFLRPLGAKPIFNGRDLSGWRGVPGSKSDFTVVDGSIHVTGGAGFLETEDVYGDFVLQAEAKTNGSELNSGIFFRAMAGTEEAPSHGYELQIHNGYADGDRTKPNDYGTGFGTGAIFRRQAARRVVSSDHEWCTLTLIADGAHMSSWVNGYQVTDWTDDRELHENPRRGRRTEAGHISLQGHDETTDLDFRNLSIGVIAE